jgi:diamine N-acetyltransferase
MSGAMNLRLVEVTPDNLDALCALDAGDGGVQVAPNQRSMAQAAVYPEAWPRGIEADGRLVGFLMLSDPSLRAGGGPTNAYYLWRFMIDQREQGRGLGDQALRLVIEHVKSRPGAEALTLSYVPDQTASERLARFYGRHGFVPTGEIDEGEVVMRLAFSPA